MTDPLTDPLGDPLPSGVVLRHDRFLPAAEATVAPLGDSWIAAAARRDRLAKLGLSDQRYVRWLGALLPALAARLGRSAPLEVLDLGCGTGELTVLMNVLGAHAQGVDVHEEHLALARLLATDNGLDPALFHVQGLSRDRGQGRLPFDDRRFDVVHLHVVLEHLSDPDLGRLLPEIRRVCRGVVHLVVPNRLQWTDDHTGLPLLPLLPRPVALAVLRWRGERYPISVDGHWDVHYRSYRTLARLFTRAGFVIEHPQDDLVFPPLADPAQHPLHRYGAVGTTPLKRAFWRLLGLAIRVAHAGTPERGYLPYLNLLLVPRTPAPETATR